MSDRDVGGYFDSEGRDSHECRCECHRPQAEGTFRAHAVACCFKCPKCGLNVRVCVGLDEHIARRHLPESERTRRIRNRILSGIGPEY
mgnify:CR=1 FL=1